MFGCVFGSVFSLDTLIHAAVAAAARATRCRCWWCRWSAGAVLLDARPAAATRWQSWWQRRAGALAARRTAGCCWSTSACCSACTLGWLVAPAAARVAGAAARAARCVRSATRVHAGARACAPALAALGELVEQHAADPDQHAVVRARRRLRAGARRAVVGGRGADRTRPTTRSAGALVLVLGNVLIIVLEGLVVSIQTTRLVLFEFFTRFLRPAGPRLPPAAAAPVHLPRRSEP
ncbi:MAG: hypothetical protein M0C28_11580 [Candidatus Moduliflexus flocculans]|nr:hypothetical protein [Candidatus Moduliflexus flocculans]